MRTLFLGAEFIAGMMVGLEFRSRLIILDCFIVRFYVGWIDDEQVS